MSADDLSPEHERVRAALADVPLTAADSRDAAIARALVEFDRLHTAPNVVAFPQRRRWYRVVAAAAAVLLVGVVGVSALKGTSRNDSSSAGEARSTARASVDSAVSAFDTSAAAQSQVGGGSDIAAQATIIAITGPAEATPQVATPDQLKVLATTDVVTTGPAPATAETASVVRISFPFPCRLAENLSTVREISYQGTPAVLVRDTVTGVIQAIDAQCNVLAASQP